MSNRKNRYGNRIANSAVNRPNLHKDKKALQPPVQTHSQRQIPKYSTNASASNPYRYIQYTQVKNCNTARVYIFGNSNLNIFNESSGSDDDIEMFDMRSRRASDKSSPKPNRKEPILFERQISETDSLIALSLQYNCSVAELKKVNHLVTDQDIYARKTIKIPIKPFSITAEKLVLSNESPDPGSTAPTSSNAGVSNSGATIQVTDTSLPAKNSVDDSSKHDFAVHNISIRDDTGYPAGDNMKEAYEFLRNMDLDLEMIRSTTSLPDSSATEDISLLAADYFVKRNEKPRSVSVCGFSVPWYVILILSLFVIIPVLIVLVFRNSIFHQPKT